MSSEDVVISARGLTKRYRLFDHPGDRVKQFLSFGAKRYHREFEALHALSFEIHRGEAVGIIGRNGSGKSTLLQLICGILKPTSGTVSVNGRISALLELGSGFNPEFTGRENVYFQGALMGFTKAEMDDRFDDIVAFADIGEFLEQPVRTYSSGMFVRLAFAVNAHLDADILVVDEALSVGDAHFVQKCIRFLKAFMGRGTVVFVSHDIVTLTQLCEKLVLLERGHLIEYGPSETVADLYMKNAYRPHRENKQIERSAEDGRLPAEKRGLPGRDMRLDLINRTPFRNDIEIQAFPGASTGFGAGGATIDNVVLSDEEGKPLSAVVGGETVALRIECHANEDLQQPLIGFLVKDESGLVLFGDNTFLTYLDNPPVLSAGDRFSGVFEFGMPILPVGNYDVTAAVADGTQSIHVQHHWVSAALRFRSLSSSAATGLLGIPMNNVRLVSLDE